MSDPGARCMFCGKGDCDTTVGVVRLNDFLKCYRDKAAVEGLRQQRPVHQTCHEAVEQWMFRNLGKAADDPWLDLGGEG